MSQTYKNNDQVLVKSGNVAFAYEAKIIDDNANEKNKKGYKIHYKGWNKKYDEIIPFEDAATRIELYTKEKDDEYRRMEKEAKETKRSEARKRAQSIDDSEGENARTKKNEKQDTTRHAVMMPKSLKRVLQNDYILVHKKKRYQIPVKHTVKSIFDEYLASKGEEMNDKDEMLIEENEDGRLTSPDVIKSKNGIMGYFDTLLSLQLLYNGDERQQFEELKAGHASQNKPQDVNNERQGKKKTPKRGNTEVPQDSQQIEFKPSDYYGLPHLLRFFTRIESLLVEAKVPAREQTGLLNSVIDMVHHLEADPSKFCEGFEYPKL